MYRYGGPVFSAFEKSDLDYGLSRKRPSSRWGQPFGVLFARRASPRLSLPTLPGAASAVLASSPWCCCSVYCYTTVAAAAALQDVPDVKQIDDVLWSMEHDHGGFFLLIQTWLFFTCTPWQYCRIYGLDWRIVPRR